MKIKKILSASALFLALFAAPSYAEKRLAVLPFDVPESRPDMKQFGIGITDTINIALSGIHDFIMIDRSQFENILKEQAFQQSGMTDPEKITKLGRLVGAEILIVGSIQTDGASYRITARLTEVETGKIIKAVQVTGSSIFDLQDKLANEIIEQQKVAPKEGVMNKVKKIINATANTTAYNYYIKGRNNLLAFNEQGYKDAINLFDKALEEDSNYTLALASKAEAEALLASELEVNAKPYRDTMEIALSNANKALTLDSNLPDSYRALSTIYKLQGKFDEGREAANKALKLNPNDADAYYLLWANSINMSKDDPNFTKAIKLNPLVVKKVLGIGYAYFKQSKYNEAISIYESILEVKPDFVYAYVGLGYAYDGLENLLKAVEYFKKAIEIKYSLADAHAGLGFVYFKLGRIDDSLKELKRSIEYNPNYSFSRSALANVYYNIGKKEESFEQYKIAVDINPDDFYARVGLGYYYYEKGMFQESYDEYKTALGINYKNVDAHYNFALLYKVNNKYNEAISEFKEALKINPKHVNSKLKLAEVYQHLNKLDEAVTQLQEVSEIKTDDSAIFNALGVIYYKKGKYKESVDNYKKALALNFADASAHNNLGIVYYVQGKIKEAQFEYQEALKINPNDWNSNENLALVYERLNRKEEAKQYYKKACLFGSQSACDYLQKK